MAIYTGTLVGLTLHFNEYPIAEEHNVIVYRQLEDGDWAMSSDEEGPFAYRPCRGKGEYDTDAMLRQAVGYMAPRARWEERPGCRSITKQGLAFWWRDKNWNYSKEASNAEHTGTAR